MNNRVTAQETRQIQIILLEKFHEFCVAEGLRYSLCGGSLIGAVRHKGFIPWDDDIDVMLPRSDYERFLREFDGAYPDIDILHYHKGTKYHLPFAKLSYNRTLRKGFEDIGVFIDVFPIDGLPQEAELESFYKKRAILDSRRYEVYYYNNPQYRQNMLPYYKAILSYLKNKFVLPSWETVVKQYDSLVSSYPLEISQLGAVIFGKYGKREIMHSSVFKDFIYLPFENHYFLCIKDYHTYLTNLYGDYMKLPPMDKRVPGHVHEVYWKELE